MTRLSSVGWLLLALVSVAGRTAPAAAPGDVNEDGRIDDADRAALTTRLFDPSFNGAPGADANRDGRISAPDFSGIVYALLGVPLPPTFTARPATRTPTRTATGTPTATPTPTPTPTSTACQPRALAPGTISDSLSPGDCPDSGNGRLSDVYSVAANPDQLPAGQAVSIEVTATGFSPRVLVRDAGIYFGTASTTTAVEFLVTTHRAYEIVVTSDAPGGMTGPYNLKVSVRNCPASNQRVFALPKSFNATLAETDCPDPVSPGSPAHRYSFTAQAGTAVSVAMRVNPTSFDLQPDPFLTIYGPTPTGAFTGIKLATDDATGGILENGLSDALISFYPVETGTYTIVASGGLGPYSMAFTLPPCPSKAGPTLPASTQVAGTLSQSSCPAPLPLPGALSTDVGTRADVWTVNAAAGDVITASMTAVDSFDAQLYLLGPDHALLTSDDNGSADGGLDAQLAYTAGRSGTYTIVAASNDPLVDQGDGAPSVAYTLDLRRCPAVPLVVDQPLAGGFSDGDCHGSGGASLVSYAMDGIAGQFVTLTMVGDQDSGLDPRLELIDPAGRRMANDDDPFVNTTDARISTTLQAGRYYVAASSDPSVGLVPGTYTLLARRCRTIPVVGNSASGNFRDDDCEVGTDDAPGGKLNVFTLSVGPSQMLSIVPPDGACLFAVTPDLVQGPATTCLSDYFFLPVIQAGVVTVMVAAGDPAVRGPFTFSTATCPAQLLNYNSDTTAGLIVGNECRDVTGLPSEFFFFRAPQSQVSFTGGVSGVLATDFANASVVVDITGAMSLGPNLVEDADNLIPLGSDLVFGLSVRPASVSGRGAYTLKIDPPLFYQ